MTRPFYLLPMALAAIVMLVFAIGLMRDDGPSFKPSAVIGTMSPEIELAGLEAGAPPLILKDYRGEIVVINFFASWCLPCRAEHPLLKRLAQTPGVRLIGIAYKDKPEEALAFLRELGDPFAATGSDMEGSAAIGFGITGVPETFVLGRDGIIRHHVAGPLTEDLLEEEMAPVLAELRG